jgi:hypothetical protein
MQRIWQWEPSEATGEVGSGIMQLKILNYGNDYGDGLISNNACPPVPQKMPSGTLLVLVPCEFWNDWYVHEPRYYMTQYGMDVLTCPSGFDIGKDGCEDIDECQENNSCPDHSSCLNDISSYSCICDGT